MKNVDQIKALSFLWLISWSILTWSLELLTITDGVFVPFGFYGNSDNDLDHRYIILSSGMINFDPAKFILKPIIDYDLSSVFPWKFEKNISSNPFWNFGHSTGFRNKVKLFEIWGSISQSESHTFKVQSDRIFQTIFIYLKMNVPQFYIQLVYKAPLCITLRIKTWVRNIRKHDL